MKSIRNTIIGYTFVARVHPTAPRASVSRMFVTNKDCTNLTTLIAEPKIHIGDTTGDATKLCETAAIDLNTSLGFHTIRLANR